MLNTRDLLMFFVEKGLIEADKVDEILQQSEENDLSIDRFMVQRGYVPEETLLKILAEEFEYALMENFDNISVPESFCKKVSIHFARNSDLIAVGENNGRYQIATCAPFATHSIDELAAILKSECEVVLAPKSQISKLITQAYQKSAGIDDTMEGLVGDPDEILDTDEEDEDLLVDQHNKPPVIRTVNNIILQALKQRVSDIHLQPYEEKLQVRYRIDGILYDTQSIPKKYQEAVISRVKIMGKMDIAEKRLPQDGRKSIKMGDSEVDIRISSVPSSTGERVVMRILDKSARVYRLENIGLAQQDFDILDHYIHYSHGIILVTGPTGSGKSTTLYSSLTRLDATRKNIMTIEDPVEYQLHSVSQINVAPKKGLTFAKGLRTLLRQDPDVIMVGEIRDEETARIATQAALTGHLVLSTIHTNDSSSAVPRLTDMGVEPYLVSSSLLCVVAQRLLRKICPGCITQYKPQETEMKSVEITEEDLKHSNGMLWKGTGCEQCMGTGYKDRCGIYEILPISEEIRELIVQRKGASAIKRQALENNLRTLRMDARQKMLEGICTAEEMLRVTQMD